jgi:hypothetical protein
MKQLEVRSHYVRSSAQEIPSSPVGVSETKIKTGAWEPREDGDTTSLLIGLEMGNGRDMSASAAPSRSWTDDREINVVVS